MQVVEKLWGREIWLVNCEDYCSKILELKVGCHSSTHHHKKKKETFYCLEGTPTLDVEGKVYKLDNTKEPVTILPKQKHSFWSKVPARILEVSTTHDEEDVYRFKKSYKIETYCFDIDGVICTNTNGSYKDAVPNKEVIDRINKLHENGHKVILYTARGTTTGIDWKDMTVRQMWDWGLNYDELVMGKPEADIFVDDKSVAVKDWA